MAQASFDQRLMNKSYLPCYISTGSSCIYDLYADHLHQQFPLDITATSGMMICYFKLIALVGHLIRLSIASIQIEADNCITDSLTIYDSLMPIKSKILYRYVYILNKKSLIL